MKMNKEQLSEAIKILEKKLRAPCPLCGGSKRGINEQVFMLPSFTPFPDPSPLGSVIVMPCVAVVCGDCGNTNLLSVYLCGLQKLLNIADPASTTEEVISNYKHSGKPH